MEQATPLAHSLAEVTRHIERVFQSAILSNATKAALRRMGLATLPPLEFFRFACEHLPPFWENHVRNWQCLIASICIMSNIASRPHTSFGSALTEAGYSEQRLERLLSADGDTRKALIMRAVRYLEHKNCNFNGYDLAALIFLSEQDPVAVERLKLRIAKDYYNLRNKEGK